MANQTFVAKNGLTANTANIFFSDVATNLTTATILIKDSNHKIGTRTPAQILSDISAVASGTEITAIAAGDGMNSSTAATSGTATITLGTPSALTAATNDAVSTGTHTHSITASDDESSGTAATLLKSTASGGLSLASLTTSGDVTAGDDVIMNSDTAKFTVGAGGDVVLTHVHNTGFLLTQGGSGTAPYLQFRDSALAVGSSADGQLDIDADTELEITAPIVDIDASTEVNISNDLKLSSDSAVLGFGAGNDATLTHTNDVGLTLNSTNKLMFNDASQFIQGSSATVLSIGATDEIDLTATAVDLNGTLDVSGEVTVQTGIVADGQDGAYLGSGTKQFSDLYLADGAQILWGDNSEITLTHDADKGLTIKHAASGDDKYPTLTLAAGDDDIAVNDVIGSIEFVAPDEGAGTDAITNAGAIRVISEGDFSATNNAAKMSFMLGSSGAAAEVMSVSSAGALTVSGNLIVSGTTTTVSSTTIEVNDPLLFLAQNNTGSDAVDIGFFGTYDPAGTDLFGGLFRDANDGKWRLFKDSQAEPDTTVNTGATGYAVATLVANLEGNVTGTLQTAAQTNVTSLGTLTALTVDNIAIDGATIGHTSDGDLLTLADGIVTVAGEISVTTLDIGGTNVTSTAAELNLLDGVSGLVQADFTKLAGVDSTATELNLMDGGSSIGTTAVSDGHGIVMNHGGTMAQTTVQTLAAYLDDEITAMPNLVTTAATTVGALNSGSITSGFGTIDTGSSTISTTGVFTGGSVVITDGSTIGSASDTDAIRISSAGAVALSNNEVLYGASNNTVGIAMTKTFSGTVSAGATGTMLTFKAKDGSSGQTGATNFLGGEVVLTLKKGSDYETKKLMIHHDGDPTDGGADIFITEFATLGTELGETVATDMGAADGTSSEGSGDEHVWLTLTAPGGGAVTYAGVAHLVEVPGDS